MLIEKCVFASINHSLFWLPAKVVVDNQGRSCLVDCGIRLILLGFGIAASMLLAAIAMVALVSDAFFDAVHSRAFLAILGWGSVVVSGLLTALVMLVASFFIGARLCVSVYKKTSGRISLRLCVHRSALCFFDVRCGKYVFLLRDPIYNSRLRRMQYFSNLHKNFFVNKMVRRRERTFFLCEFSGTARKGGEKGTTPERPQVKPKSAPPSDL